MNPALRHFSIQVPPVAEEETVRLIESHFNAHPSAYHDLVTDRSTVSIYLECDQAQTRKYRSLLKSIAKELAVSGIRPEDIKCQAGKVRPENWSESWKRHFKPMEIGGRILVKPYWNRRKPRKGQVVVTLNPGLSFGTGQHPTTRFCLAQLEKASREFPNGAFLDAGTGSGILAIAASKLGFRRIDAFDNDPDAIKVALENTRLNHLSGLKFSCRDLTKMKPLSKPVYNILCANLTHDLLKDHAPVLISRLHPDGVLVLAGILNEQFRQVTRTYQTFGMRESGKVVEGEWTSGSFRFD